MRRLLIHRWFTALLLVMAATIPSMAQQVDADLQKRRQAFLDSIVKVREAEKIKQHIEAEKLRKAIEADMVKPDTTVVEAVVEAAVDTITKDLTTITADSSDSTDIVDLMPVLEGKQRKMKVKRDWSTWTPDPQRALWLALVIPGAGQIYNRKFWKLPIIYGGFMGCIYALTWNNMMYKDYSQAYLDIMDDDPGTASYNKFLHLGKQITPENEERYKQIFKSRKDKYRRWRDMSFFVMLGVYAVSVIDAYVDAELSVFDISKDLSLHVEPAVIPNHGGGNWLDSQSLGVSCKLNF